MDNKNTKILEALQMQPLSDEEKTSRHILGRLYGPIATYKESTRNDRLYNKELWENALKDEIFQEKVKNKSLFLELGHPTDREETDMTKVCACIPEMPKIVDGDLYAYVDILDTANGQLLKKLCDYGFVPGISSRGSGDIMENNEVDPETFFLETWDIVQLPAVKKARLSVCESVDTEALKMKKALAESYNKADDDTKKMMKEALDNLNIKLDEGDLLPGGTPVDPNEIELDETGLMEAEKPEVEEEPKEDAKEDEAEDEEKVEAPTVGDFVKELKDYDKDLNLEFKPIAIDDKEYAVSGIEFDDGEDGKLVATVVYDLATDDNKDELPEDEKSEGDIDNSDDAENKETEVEPEEASDAGDDGVIESLKELVRQKDMLESELKTLKGESAVSDAKVKELQEELNKYKSGFARVSELAAKSTKFEKEAKGLSEQLAAKDAEIRKLTEDAAKHTKINESVDANASKVKMLTEKLTAMQQDNKESTMKLNEQLGQYKKRLQERTEVAKAYKSKYQAVLERYIESKASMLGVRKTEITNRLDENYSMDDIDNVCDEILTEEVRMPNLPFGSASKIKVHESVTPSAKKTYNPDNGYEIDDDLLELAGLK